jgi:uncharacterized Tic20 family protein/DNA-binding XRE family transcriptional regulator
MAYFDVIPIIWVGIRKEANMNQPDLGYKVAELRQLKGLTQEQLAERCEVNPRTVQRIESGEVDPRSYTLQCLSRELEFNFFSDNNQNDSIWLVVMHLSSIIPMLIIPLLLWSWKKNQSSKINEQGREVLNFQITMMLLLFLGGFLLIFFTSSLPLLGKAMDDIGMNMGLFEIIIICAPMPMAFIGLFCTYLGISNAIRSLGDKPIRYPLSIPFVK